MSASGTVKFFNVTKGFGFIIQDDGNPDVFVHGSDVTGNSLNEGDKVNFEIEVREDGRSRAVNVSGGTREGGWGDREDGGYNNNRGGYKGYNEGGYGGRNNYNDRGNDRGGYGSNDRGFGGGFGGQKRNICFSFRDSGNCRFGDNCKFSHEMN